MSVPTFDRFMEPVLRVLAGANQPVRAADLYEAAADRVGLTPEDREQLIPSGKGKTYKNRIGWAQQWLKHAGYTESPRWGQWVLTAEGRDYVASHPGSLSEQEVAAIIQRARVRSPALAEEEPKVAGATEVTPPLAAGLQSPDDRIESAIAEIRARTSSELLDAVLAASPLFFERLVLELLHNLGYGTSRGDLQVVGGSGDGGIDGIISLDKLGFEKVYVQAKRWKNPVGAPEIQGFYGALAGRRASKGVFITSSSFTRQAREFGEHVSDKVVLIDGTRLATLMMDYRVGVTAQTILVPKIDRDYFSEDE